MIYDEKHISQKLSILDKAIEIYGATLAVGFDQSVDHVQGIINTAMKIEEYVFSPNWDSTKVDPRKPVVLTETQKREQFLASLPTVGCGTGKEGCDGSEGKCNCQ